MLLKGQDEVSGCLELVPVKWGSTNLAGLMCWLLVAELQVPVKVNEFIWPKAAVGC